MQYGQYYGYRDTWPDYGFSDIPYKHPTYSCSDTPWHRTYEDWEKSRGVVDREEWMCEKFGADWRLNDRVASRRE